jgi:hypothetical protein
MIVQPMNITADQKDKLIQMCNGLYPDHIFNWTLYPNMIRIEDNLFEDVKTVNIHWFELTCTYILDKLYIDEIPTHNEFRKSSNILFEVFMYYNNNTYLLRKSTFFGEDHPIDMMYDKFKNL